MSNYITTNIRLPEEDYLRLKEEAFKKRKSLSAIVRGKLVAKKKHRSEAEVKNFMKSLDKVASEIAKHTKGFNSVKALREMRYKGKW
ncbi:MAG: hypothetical protein Q8Q15_03670 [bacterium]|nr:hypothetical protein [bacterium]